MFEQVDSIWEICLFILIGLSKSGKLDFGGQFKQIFMMEAKENLKYQEYLQNGKSTFHLQFHVFLTKFSIPFLSCWDLIPFSSIQ